MRAIAGLACVVGMLSGCKSSQDSSGGLVILVDTNMAVPKDIDHIDVLVTQDGKAILNEHVDLGSNNLLPTTFELHADRSAGPSVKIQGVARSKGKARIIREAVAAIPSSGLFSLQLPLDWLCDDTAVEPQPGVVRSTCPDGLTCIEGVCSPEEVGPDGLTPYDPNDPKSAAAANKQGGGSKGAGGACFDARACFAGAHAVPLDPNDCSLPTPDGAVAATLNLAVKQPPGSVGVCDASSCLVVLDRDGPGGWNPSGGPLGPRISLPKGICARAQNGTLSIIASSACPTKTSDQEACVEYSVPVTPGQGVAQACDGPAEQACGNCGTQIRTCVNGSWSDWGQCNGEGVCTPNASESCGTGGFRSCGGDCRWTACANQTCSAAVLSEACGNCGTRTRTCSNGVVSAWSACSDQGTCAPNASEACANGGQRTCGGLCQWGACSDPSCAGPASQACGNCGTQTRTCSAGAWSDWSACSDGACAPNQTQTCGTGGTETCGGSCQWGPCAGQTCVGPASQACGDCGTQTRTCDNGTWSDWSVCSTGGVCTPNTAQQCGSGGIEYCGGLCQWGGCTNQSCPGPSAQTCGNCGTQTRTCNNGVWSAFGACGSEGCAPGSNQVCGADGSQTCNASCQWDPCDCVGPSSQICGNCGTQTRTCNAGTWQAWSACGGEGVCTPSTTQPCGTGVTQTCNASCQWDACPADLQTDPLNCGVLGHNCLGTTCTSGICDGVALSTGGFEPLMLALDSDGVYWIDYGQIGSVNMVGLNGGPVTTLGGLAYPGGVAASATKIFWTTQGTDFLGNQPTSAVSDILKTDFLDGGTEAGVQQIHNGGKPFAIAADSSYVYYADYVIVPGFFIPPNDIGHLYRMPLSGGPEELLESYSFIATISLDADSVYFTTWQSGVDAVYQRPKEGGANLAWPISTNQTQPSTAVSDGTYVYWVGLSGAPPDPDAGPVVYGVDRIPKTTGPGPAPTPVVLASGEPGPRLGLAVDATNVYWPSNSGFIKSVPIGGGTVRQVARTNGAVDYVQLDSQWVYWTDEGGGNVMKVAKF
jgi:hypothetical protein